MSSFDDIFSGYQFGTSNESRLSPLIPPVSTSETLPLTTGRLQKKDELDVLLFDTHTIQRRRSICCGNIYRHLYNHNNSPIILSKPLKKKDSDNSDASVNSHRSVTSDFLRNTQSIDSSRGRTVPERVFSMHQTDFPGLVKLSAEHIIAIKKSRQGTGSFISKLEAVASYVIDPRISEPKPTRMSVEEVTSLASYLYNPRSIQERLDEQAADNFGSPDTSNTSSSETDRLLPLFTPSYDTIPISARPYEGFAGLLQRAYANFLLQQQLHTHIRFEGWSLYYFSPQSLTRFYLWKIIGSRWFEIGILILLFIQWIILSFAPIRFDTDQKLFSGLGDYLIFFISIVYTFEAISKIIVYGLLFTCPAADSAFNSWMMHRNERRPSVFSIKEDVHETSIPIRPHSSTSSISTADTSMTAEHQVMATLIPDDEYLKINHASYLSSLSNTIDLISIVAYWIDIIMILFSDRNPWSILQAMAAMRLLRFLIMTEGTAAIMKSLRSSYDMLKNVMGFFVFFLILFSLVALFIFMNAFNRRCAIMPDTPLEKNMSEFKFVNPRVSCSGYMFNNTKKGVYDIDIGHQFQQTGNGLFCKQGQVCIQGTQIQPGYHHISFQNIFYAMLNIMTVISTEDWTDLMYISQDSISNVGSAFFYCGCIYLMTFIIVPMFIAVITTSFSRVRGDMRQSAFSSKRKVLLAVKPHHLKHNGEEWIYVDRVHKLKGGAYTINAAWFMYLGSLSVLMHVVCMTFYNANLSTKDKSRLDTAGQIFTWLLTIEIIIRIYYHCNWSQFWKVTRNRVDLCIVIATVMDEASVIKQSKYHIYLLAFRVLRSYRIAYLFPGVTKLLSDVIGDGQGIRNLIFFTFLVLSLLAPISVQLFGGDFNFVQEDEPAMRFDNSYQAFLAIFQIMTGENWTDILYASMHSQEHASVTCAALFVVSVYFAVHYIVLNLFIAVIIENFDLDEENIKQIQIKKYIREHRWKPEYFKMDYISRFLLPLFVLQDEQKLSVNSLPPHLVAHVAASKFKKFLAVLPPVNYHASPKKSHHYLHRRNGSSMSQFSVKSLLIDPMPYASTNEEPHVKYGDEYELNVARENKAVIVDNLDLFRSMAIFEKDSKARKFCTSLKNLPYYNRFICTCICVSTLLAMWADESNRLTHPVVITTILEPIQTCLLVLFWLDGVVHMAADGILMLPKSYLRNTRNFLDMMNLLAQVVFTVKLHPSYLRILRTLRSIGIVYHVQGMRIIFLDLVHGLPKMIDVVALNVLVFVPFAIYGCYLFSGKFSLCNDESATSIHDCYHEFRSTDDENSNILLPRVWKNPYNYSFDTFGESLLHLFECASGEGWIMSLFSAMSVPQTPTDQAQFGWSSSSVFHSLFYVVFMFVASLCSIQLFIGVFLEIFKQRSGIFALTNTQRQFRDLQRQLALVKPSLKVERPQNAVRAKFYDLVINKQGSFARFMVIVLTVNIIVFATEHSHQPPLLTFLQNMLNSIFICLYVFEMVAKIAGLGFYKWASARWNIYDFILVGLTICTTVPRFYISLPFGWNVARKLFSIGIAFRLAQRSESLNTLFRSIRRALPSIFYVSTVFAIVIVCFGVTFQENFSSTRYGLYGNEHANFRSLYTTILTLFRITTGENWDFLMHDFTILPPDCVGKDDCGSPNYAIALFISFYVICTYIFVNLFTAIVIDNLSFTFDTRNQLSLITRTDLRCFKAAWSNIDPTASGYISIKDIPRFLSSLDGALSVRIYEEKYSLESMLDASNQVDTDPSHLILVPLSEFQQKCNNMLTDRYFNIYELNQALSSIDREMIRERKRQYTLIYREIANSASHKGVSFHDMLEILAIQLVDISKSLTFEELVNRARVQDKIAKDLEAEKAKSLIDMLVQRRKFLKVRQRSKLKRVKSNSAMLIGNWLKPLADQTSETSYASGRAQSLSRIRRENVPAIIVDQSSHSVDTSLYHRSLHERMSQAPNITPILLDGRKNKRETIPVPVTSKPPAGILSELSQNSLSSSNPSQGGLEVWPRKSLDLKSMFIKGAPLEDFSVSQISPVDVNDTIFTRYTSDKAIDHMTNPDAEQILHEFQKSNWSSLLDESASD